LREKYRGIDLSTLVKTLISTDREFQFTVGLPRRAASVNQDSRSTVNPYLPTKRSVVTHTLLPTDRVSIAIERNSWQM